jgi:hypothetical protein
MGANELFIEPYSHLVYIVHIGTADWLRDCSPAGLTSRARATRAASGSQVRLP